MEYIKTYFRIRSKYCGADGWQDDADKAKFEEEACTMFQSLGWEIEKSRNSSFCNEASRGKENLYLHPMLFEGVVLETSIPEIEKAFSAAQSFQHYHTDTYARYYDMSDTDYLLHLRTKREDMIMDILQVFRTKRRNLFITDTDAPLQHVQKKYHICRVGEKGNKDTILTGVLNNLFLMLSARGDLIQSDTRNGVGYRTATEKDKKEQKTA